MLCLHVVSSSTYYPFGAGLFNHYSINDTRSAVTIFVLRSKQNDHILCMYILVEMLINYDRTDPKGYKKLFMKSFEKASIRGKNSGIYRVCSRLPVWIYLL